MPSPPPSIGDFGDFMDEVHVAQQDSAVAVMLVEVAARHEAIRAQLTY